MPQQSIYELLEQMKKELYSVVDRYTEKLKQLPEGPHSKYDNPSLSSIKEALGGYNTGDTFTLQELETPTNLGLKTITALISLHQEELEVEPNYVSRKPGPRKWIKVEKQEHGRKRFRELKKGAYYHIEDLERFYKEISGRASPPSESNCALPNNVYSVIESIKEYGEDSLAHLDLSGRTYNALRRAGIDTISQLRERLTGIRDLRHVGEKTEEGISTVLEEFDRLRQTV